MLPHEIKYKFVRILPIIVNQCRYMITYTDIYLYILIPVLRRIFGDNRITTIVIQNETRKLLKQIGKKGQTYDQIIEELIRLKSNWRKDLLDHGIETPGDQANPAVHKEGDSL
jgi:hypothetical protein